jgi:hypothetical protein
MPDYDDEKDTDDLGEDEDPDPSDQDSTDDEGEECPNCGKYIYDDAAICPHCLHPIDPVVSNWRGGKSWFVVGLISIVVILTLIFLAIAH